MTTSRAFVLAAVISISRAAGAQELEPGQYQDVPIRLNVAAASFALSRGNVLFDATVPITDGSANIQVVGLGYVRTLAVFGRPAKFDVQVPVSWGTFKGLLAGEYRERTVSGLADPRVRLAVNFIGIPALELPAFVRQKPRTAVGATLQVQMPLGQYEEERLVNLGTNRWSFRPEIGISHTWGRLTLEGAGGGWLFTDNEEYYLGTTLDQAPLWFARGSGIWTFRNSFWTALNYGRGTGGETRIDDGPPTGLQRNDRLSVTLVMPLGGGNAIRTVYTSGLSTRTGADFDSIAIGFQRTWRHRALQPRLPPGVTSSPPPTSPAAAPAPARTRRE